jgi:membrane fusion protein, heavy metal efflux system
MKLLSYLCLFILITTVSCRNSEPEQQEDHHDVHEAGEENIIELSADQFKAAGITLGKIGQKQISGTIKVSGVLDVPPQQLVSVSAPLGGFLKDTKLLEGSRVRKGQVIASIENMEFIQIQQDYLESKNQFEFAKADYERQQELAKENVNSQKVLQQSKTSFLNWQAKYSALREKLRLLNLDVGGVESGNIRSTINLYSPIDGYVTQVNVNLGKFVNPTDVLFEIVDTEHLHAELIVFEKDVPKLKIGQRVRFTLANETEERTATVYLIGREIGKDRTVQIHCHIDKEDRELLPGMYLNAVVETGGALVPALPNGAIADYQGNKFVFVLDGIEQKESMEFQLVPVQTLNSEDGYTEIAIADSLKDKRIVTQGGYALLSKMKNSEDEGHSH